MDLENSKESVYGALDAWVAWEQDFPIGPLRRALIALEKEHQWHRIIHVIKWMLSIGQGTTLGTYGQLVRALDMDHRVEEAHEVWVKKLAVDLHSGLEAFARKPRDKKIVKKVGDAYEVLGMEKPHSHSQTVVVENPMSVDESGKLVNNVVVGVTMEKK
ncbi:hypothetical protein Tco_0461043 [Tanacetum coccineum]